MGQEYCIGLKVSTPFRVELIPTFVTKRAEREAKDQAKAKGKGKHGRKRKSLPEVGAPELRAKVARLNEAQVKED